jgi:putative hydrolase of the HAD superfamily
MVAMKAIFFDFFGVLSTPPYSPFIKKYLPKAEQLAWLDKLKALDLGELAETELVRQLSRRLGTTEAGIWAEINSTPQPNEALYSFIQRELKTKYTVGLLTNVPRALIERIAGERLRLFDELIISSDVKLIKPDPRIFELTVQRTGQPAHEVVFIDDRAPNIDAAQRAGLQTILYTGFDAFVHELKRLT